MATVAATLPTPRRGDSYRRAAGRTIVPDVYYVKRIDNSRLRREVDTEKRRECYSLLGLGILVFFLGLLFAWQHFQCVRYGYQIQELKSQGAEMEEWNRQLRVEEAALAEPQRIDAVAREKLGLAPPAPQQIVRVGAAAGSSVDDTELARVLASAGGAGGAAPAPDGGIAHREP